MRLDNQVAIITGGTGGLGLAVVKAFLQDGAQVVAPYRSHSKLEGLLSHLGDLKGRLTSLQADVTQRESVTALVAKTLEQFGKTDILINIVGGFAGGTSVAETDEEAWDNMMSLNLKSAFLCCRAVVPHMVERGRGKIISVSSRAALKGGARVSAYSASKAGVIILTESLAEEVKDSNINVNAILPSVIDTEANRQARPKADFSRWVKPEEIAQVMLFLVSEEARALNGAAIPVYGRV
ncbi:MAG: SDR family oxidoreductase [Dehalococcoidia bacterium]